MKAWRRTTGGDGAAMTMMPEYSRYDDDVVVVVVVELAAAAPAVGDVAFQRVGSTTFGILCSTRQAHVTVPALYSQDAE